MRLPACMRSVHGRNSAVEPFHRRSSTLPNKAASVLNVARSLNSSACSRRSPSTAAGKSSIAPCLFNSRAAETAPIPQCRDSHPRRRPPTPDSRESSSGLRQTSCARRLHRESAFLFDRPARRDLPRRTAPGLCRASRCKPSRRRIFGSNLAADASASSASSSIIGQTTTPIAESASSNG